MHDWDTLYFDRNDIDVTPSISNSLVKLQGDPYKIITSN